jgi:hypothetical protein
MKKLALMFLLAIGLSANSQTTQISAAYCGQQASSATQFIWADSVGTPAVANTDRYIFQLINGVTTLTWQTNNQWPIMQWYLIPGFAYSTTYTASVAYSSNSGATFGAFGGTCTIISPSFPTTSLQPGYCSYNATSYNSLIHAEPVINDSLRFRLRNTSLSYNQTFTKKNANFILSQFTGLQNSTTYSVDISVKYNGSFGPYGGLCLVTTPAAPTTSIVSGECGAIATSYTNQIFHVEPVTGFDCYFYNFTDGVSTYTLEKCNNNNFILDQLSPQLPTGTQFTVTVKVQYNGVYGPFGDPCTITTPASYMRLNPYPNPFTEGFYIESEQAEIQDMYGNVKYNGNGGHIGKDLKQGVYYLKTKEGTSKIIKN